MKNACTEFILGGQKSGKSRRAEALARQWLAASAQHRAVLIATALAGDDEMRERVARHQRDRAEHTPGMVTLEEPLHLAEALRQHSTEQTLVVIDCLPLWLTNWLMALDATLADPAAADAAQTDLLTALASADGPVVVVSNEIGLGVIPLGVEVRAYVDALGVLNQAVAALCNRVTFMAAGVPLTLKDAA